MTANENKRKSCGHRLIGSLVVSAFVIAVVVGLSIAFTGSPNPVDYFIPVDPPGRTEAVRWDAVQGLTLVVENACEDRWSEVFDQSVLEWNETDALRLLPRKVQYDYDCHVSMGRLKVCNGDYGDTDWRGINTVVLHNKLISYSTAKLNDRHLQTPDDQLYTMCHELGHGFGLPHTDENHLNRDRGECMDYTDNPGNNLIPGDFNLNLLETLYGTHYRRVYPDGAPTPSPTSAPAGTLVAGMPTSDSTATTPNSPRQYPWLPSFRNGEDSYESNKEKEKEEKGKEKEDKKKNKDDRFRSLRGLSTVSGDESQEDGDLAVPQWYQEQADLETQRCHKAYCGKDLGEGYRVEVFKFLK